MKHLITIILIVTVVTQGLSQHTFKYIRHNQNTDIIPIAVIEDTLGNTLVVYEEGRMLELHTCHLMVLSPQGNVINDTEFDMTGYVGYTVIEKVKNSYYIMGSNFISKNATTFNIYKINSNYEPLLINSWNINNKRVNRPQIHEMADGRIVLSTGISEIHEYLFNELLFIEFDNKWDTVKTIHYPNIDIWEIQYYKTIQSYIMIGGDSDFKSTSVLIYLDNNLNVIKEFSYILSPSLFSGLRFCNNNILIIGSGHSGKGLELVKTDTSGKEINTIPLGGENILQQMATNKAIVNSANGMFFGYSFQWDANVPYSMQPMALHLVKFDSSMNIAFEKYYVDNASYSAMDFTPSADGGCIMAAMVFDTAVNKTYLGIQILKVDSLGNYTSTDIAKTALRQSHISLYPNPGNNEIDLQLPDNNKTAIFSLYNISGKKVLSKQANAAQTTITTEQLPTGLYIYELRKNGVVLDRGKWVKR